MKTIILSLGGSLLFDEFTKNPSVQRIWAYASWLKKLTKTHRVVVVVGGGIPARQYITAGKKFTKKFSELDMLGIGVTRLNAELVRLACGKSADKNIISDPRIKLPNVKKVFVGSGWKPGRSTDYDAIILAKYNKVDTVINLSNILYLYDKDPKKNVGAKKIEDISWKNLFKIIGKNWKPGLNLPFDPVAAKEASKSGIIVKLINGQSRKLLENAIKGGKFTGTVIHS